MSSDDDFIPKATSKLASLFSSSKSSNSTEHSFDIHKSRKPMSIPKVSGTVSNSPEMNSSVSAPSSSSSNSSVTLQLITAKVVQAFTLKDNKYESHGKLAAALLGKASLKYYQIILYNDKKDHVAKSFITSSYWFGVQGNNYASFYDLNNVVWTVMFTDLSDFVEFCTEVALAKWISSEQKQIMVQELVALNNGRLVKKFDNIKINYLVWQLDDQYRPAKETVLNGTSDFCLSLNDEWEKCMIDVVENSRRLLVLPKNLAGPWEKIIGKSFEYGLLLDLTVESVIVHQQPSDTFNPPNIELVLPKLPSNDEESKDKNTEKENNSSWEQPSENTSSRKSYLLPQIGSFEVKLPMKDRTAVESDDTEEDMSSVYSGPSVRHGNKTKHSQKTKSKPVHYSEYPQQPVLPNYSHQQLVSNSVIGYPALTALSPVPVSPIIDQQIPVLFSELRIHNSELRMGLNSVTDKIDRVSDKIQVGPEHKVVQQLENMNKEILKQFTSLSQLNTDIHTFLMSEVNEVPETKTGTVVSELESEKIDEMQKENDKLRGSLVHLTKMIEEVKEKIKKSEAEKNELEIHLATEKEELAELRRGLVRTALESCDKPIDKIGMENFETSLLNFTDKVQQLQKSLNALDLTVDHMSTDSSEKMDALTIRECMNNLYKLLKLQFKPNMSYNSVDIHEIFNNTSKSFY